MSVEGLTQDDSAGSPEPHPLTLIQKAGSAKNNSLIKGSKICVCVCVCLCPRFQSSWFNRELFQCFPPQWKTKSSNTVKIKWILILLFSTVCKPCQDGWMQFKSNCYLFEESGYYYHWRTWEGSRSKCKEVMADLVVIESLEEQVRSLSAGSFTKMKKKWTKIPLHHIGKCAPLSL